MALTDIIGGEPGRNPAANRFAVHIFFDILHFHKTQPTVVNAQDARGLMEAHLGRSLTGSEVSEIQTLLSLDDFNEAERAYRLVEQGLITRAQAQTLLGL